MKGKKALLVASDTKFRSLLANELKKTGYLKGTGFAIYDGVERLREKMRETEFYFRQEPVKKASGI